MIRLFIKDHETGKVHEYGTNPHDSLIVAGEGSIHYYNLQNGEGTVSGAYSFCDKNGNDPMDKAIKTHWAVMPFVHTAKQDIELMADTIDLITEDNEEVFKSMCAFVSETARTIEKLKKQGYTNEEIISMLIAPDEGAPESLHKNNPQTGESPHA